MAMGTPLLPELALFQLTVGRHQTQMDRHTALVQISALDFASCNGIYGEAAVEQDD